MIAALRRAVLVLLLLTFSAVSGPIDVHVQTASVNKLLLTIQQLDLSGVPVLNRQVGFVSYNGTVGTFTTANLASGANVISLPSSVILQLYVKNTHATNNVTVTLTPQGGASAITQVLGPGAVFALWQTSTASTYGITALTLTASGANTTVEYFLGG
jgi:hypothetical protein